MLDMREMRWFRKRLSGHRREHSLTRVNDAALAIDDPLTDISRPSQVGGVFRKKKVVFSAIDNAEKRSSADARDAECVLPAISFNSLSCSVL